MDRPDDPMPEPTLSRPVRAALRRRRIPVWALPVLLSLPLWGYVYQGTLEPPPRPDDSPLAQGELRYALRRRC